jgi:acetyl-CoA carboxylase carboxyltransferase component
MNGMDAALNKLKELREKASLGGGSEKIAKLKQKGYLTCEERINLIVDPGTFLEWHTFAGPQPAEFGPSPPYIPRDGVITGFGKIDGRTVGLYAHDKTVQGGSLGNVHAAKISSIIRKCCELKVPLIALQDSVGARIQEGNKSIGFDSIFYALTQASGVVPTLSAILGTCAGGIAYSSALMDFIIMVKEKSQLFSPAPSSLNRLPMKKSPKKTWAGPGCTRKKAGSAISSSKTNKRPSVRSKHSCLFCPAALRTRRPDAIRRTIPKGGLMTCSRWSPRIPKNIMT